MKALLLVPVCLVLACAGGEPPPRSVAVAPVPGDPAAAGPAPARAGPAHGSLAGRYHLQEVDAVNLELHDGGEFRLSVNGCDYGSLECGRWESDGDRVRLLPGAGNDRIHWFAQSSFRAEVSEIVLAAAADGVTAKGTSRHAGPFQQHWASGGICADCGREGPSGSHACSEPIPSCERR